MERILEYEEWKELNEVDGVTHNKLYEYTPIFSKNTKKGMIASQLLFIMFPGFGAIPGAIVGMIANKIKKNEYEAKIGAIFTMDEIEVILNTIHNDNLLTDLKNEIERKSRFLFKTKKSNKIYYRMIVEFNERLIKKLPTGIYSKYKDLYSEMSEELLLNL